jgi:hypothetical protein
MWVCVNCGGTPEGKLLMCSLCKVARYCSLECQRSHWSDHKRHCSQRLAELDPVKGTLGSQLAWPGWPVGPTTPVTSAHPAGCFTPCSWAHVRALKVCLLCWRELLRKRVRRGCSLMTLARGRDPWAGAGDAKPTVEDFAISATDIGSGNFSRVMKARHRVTGEVSMSWRRCPASHATGFTVSLRPPCTSPPPRPSGVRHENDGQGSCKAPCSPPQEHS